MVLTPRFIDVAVRRGLRSACPGDNSDAITVSAEQHDVVIMVLYHWSCLDGRCSC
jgi:hypothetical protein